MKYRRLPEVDVGGPEAPLKEMYMSRTSPVLLSFLKKTGVNLKEYLEVEGLHDERARRASQIQLVLNLMYVIRWPAICIGVAGATSFVASLWLSRGFNTTMISLGFVSLPCVGFILFRDLEERVEELGKPLPNIRIQKEFGQLVKTFARYSYLGENVVWQASVDDLRVIADKTLRDMANTLENVEQDGDRPLRLMARNELREFHSVAYELGLCKADWGHYFKAKA